MKAINIRIFSLILLVLIVNNSSNAKFVHPGIIHTASSIERMKSLVDAKVEPAYGSWMLLLDHKCSQADYQPYGPYEIISRDGEYGWTKPHMEDDFAAAWQNALIWALTEDEAHAQKSLEILLGYADKLKVVPDTNDAPLLVGLEGLRIAYATELLYYTYPKMTKADFKKISKMLKEVFVPVMEKFYNRPAYTNGNWGPIVTSAYMALGIMWDDQKMYDKAVDFYLHANDNGTIENYIDGETGQLQESGRDQGHSMLGIGALATVCELAWQQGQDLYSALDNRLMKGFEYVAKYNQGEEVPFKQWTDVTGKYSNWPTVSDKSRGNYRPVFEMGYNHYVVRKGFKMPWTEKFLISNRPEGVNYDHPGFGSLLFNEWSAVDGEFNVDESIAYCHSKIRRYLEKNSIKDSIDYSSIPVSIAKGGKNWNYAGKKDWRLGFWPGILWMDYRLTGDPKVKKAAEGYTDYLSFLTESSPLGHDLGFLIYCSYGNALQSLKNEKELPASDKLNDMKNHILAAADSLATLYNPNVGTILSWPGNIRKYGGHNTIIDNMMNLELLFWAAQNGGSQENAQIAFNHSEKTMQNAFREDGSTYHVMVYDPKNGEKLSGLTHQGYADESMWARGQSWAIYGFCMAYRFTKDIRFLKISEKAADVYLERLPEDLIPYWDFDYPAIPNAAKDASAAAITASALIELSTYLEEQKSKEYLDKAKSILASLNSNLYRSNEVNDSFLLHSTGHHPSGKEIDCSLIYADYYFLEALERLKSLNDKNTAYNTIN